MKKSMKTHIVLIVILLISVGCQQPEEEKSITKEVFCLNENMRDSGAIVSVKKQPVIEKIHLTGNIESNSDQVVHFISLVDGIISRTFFSLGDYVTKGQVLAEMQSTELSSLQASLQTLQAQLEVAQVAVKSTEQLFEDGIASQKEVVEAQNNLQVLQSEKTRIESNLQFFSAHSSNNVFQIKAPASGIITSKNINSGTTVTEGGETLFSITDLSTVWAMVNIYATEIADIHSGMEAEIKTLSYPDEVFHGKIEVVSQILDPEARVVKARIVLDNEDLKLKPGMLADISVIKTTGNEEVSVPTSSIIFFNNKNYVLVYDGDCLIETREVKILTENNGTTYIENGLHENEKIITQNQLLIFEELSSLKTKKMFVTDNQI